MITPKSSGTVDPKTLTNDEAAFVAEYVREQGRWLDYHLAAAYAGAFREVVAKRLAAESPATGAKVCPNCHQAIESEGQHLGWTYSGGWCFFTCTPATVAEPEKVKTCGDFEHDFRNGNCMKCGKNVNPYTLPTPEPDSSAKCPNCNQDVAHIDDHYQRGSVLGGEIVEPGYGCEFIPIASEVHALVLWCQRLAASAYGEKDRSRIYADIEKCITWTRAQPAPDRCPKPEGELAEAVRNAVEQLRFAAEAERNNGHACADFRFRAADALESWARSQAATAARKFSMTEEQDLEFRRRWAALLNMDPDQFVNGVPAYVDIHSRCQELWPATAGGVTVEKVVEILETERAEWMSDDADKAIKDCIAAVRAQASGAKREMSEGLIVAALEKVREKWSKSAYTDTVFYLVNDCIDAIKAEYGGRP